MGAGKPPGCLQKASGSLLLPPSSRWGQLGPPAGWGEHPGAAEDPEQHQEGLGKLLESSTEGSRESSKRAPGELQGELWGELQESSRESSKRALGRAPGRAPGQLWGELQESSRAPGELRGESSRDSARRGPGELWGELQESSRDSSRKAPGRAPGESQESPGEPWPCSELGQAAVPACSPAGHHHAPALLSPSPAPGTSKGLSRGQLSSAAHSQGRYLFSAQPLFPFP